MTRLDRWIYEHFGDEWCGNIVPPGSRNVVRFGEEDCGEPMHVAAMGNDGFELMLGYPDRWLAFYSMGDARRIAWFVLWTVWARGTWFGLRRRIWYWSLHRIVNARRHLPRFEERRDDGR